MSELAEVAARVTKTRYPAASIVPDPTMMEWHENMVLKRNFSDASDHVIHRYTENRDATIIAQVNETNEHYKGLKIRGTTIFPTWFIVPHISQLLDIGEIRVFFVRGEILYMVFTRPKKINNPQLTIYQAHYVTPLEDLS
jgi:hypothetical protein